MPTTRVTYRRKLGEALGRFFVGTAFSGSTTTLVTASPSFLSSEIPTDSLAYGWVYLPNGTTPKLRRITAAGVNGATATWTVDGVFGSAVANGTVFEYSARLPSARDLADAQGEVPLLGLNEAVDLALEHLLEEDGEIPLALVNGQREYSLSAYPWLDRPERLIDVLEPNALGTGYRPTRRKWEFREGVREHTLWFDNPYRFTTGAPTIKLEARRPADTLIYRSGSWVESTTGLLYDTDAAGPTVNTVVDAGLYFCYAELARVSRGATRARYEALAEQQLAKARSLRQWDTTNDVAAPRQDAPAPAAAAGAA